MIEQLEVNNDLMFGIEVTFDMRIAILNLQRNYIAKEEDLESYMGKLLFTYTENNGLPEVTVSFISYSSILFIV